MKRQANRLDGGSGTDRSKVLQFSFNGRSYHGYQGDTLASALLANGVRLVGRSFKYHRPRGIFSCGMEEPNALVQLGRGAWSEPNMRATQVELFNGLEARSINCWPSVKFDIWAINNLISNFLPAGFYYKTFMWPKSFWRLYEKIIRRGAGLGTAPPLPDQNLYDKVHKHCDVLVLGGGMSGIAAALEAGRSGARVILVDEQNELGGSMLGIDNKVETFPGASWLSEAAKELKTIKDTQVLTRTTAFGYYDHNYILMVERLNEHAGSPQGTIRQRLWKVRARKVIVATGAIERPMVFSNNDRPGVMLASAVRVYINRFAVCCGKRAVIYTNNDGAYSTAIDLLRAGVKVEAVVDQRVEPTGELTNIVRELGVKIFSRHCVVSALGRNRLNAIKISEINETGDGYGNDVSRLRCDLLCVSGGWNPTIHMYSQSGGTLRYDNEKTCFVPDTATQEISVVGSANGTFSSKNCIAEGINAGRSVSREFGLSDAGLSETVSVDVSDEEGIEAIWRLPEIYKGEKSFVDLHNDVAVSDIELAVREGYTGIEHLKRYTTAGMGPDQGRTGNIAVLAILGTLTGLSIPSVGTTTFRPPYTPVSYGAMAGRDVGEFADPVRMTALHGWHKRAGAIFENVGQWKRPWYYPADRETMEEAVRRECLAARKGVVILDASTLGKIEIKGPDSAEFLNRVYTNNWDKLGIGKCRYGLMLTEDGMVMDDGVTTRLAESHFLMTTTTGGAGRVFAWLEDWLQCEWPELKVYTTSVTEQWATISLSGPNARRLLSEVSQDIDLSADAFPHMAMKEAVVAGIDARIFRVSFTGELGYEVNVPNSYALAVWEALHRVGEGFDLTPIGTEALHVLRAEKGYIAVGHDTDGSVTPNDLGMDWLVSKKKDFIGRRSLKRSDTMRANRKQLVGLLPDKFIPEGSQIVDSYRRRPPMEMIGHVSSSYESPTLKRPFALGLIKGGHDRIGETVTIPLPLKGRVATAEVVSPIFYDPSGEKLNA